MNSEKNPKSFFDTDFYKLTMGQFVFHRYPEIPVRYAFKNRTRDVKLANILDLDRLTEELDEVKVLKPTSEELNYLASLEIGGKKLFQQDYLDFLREIKLPSYVLSRDGEQIGLEIFGPWSSGIYWETPALATINSLYYRTLEESKSRDEISAIREEGKSRLEEKIRILKSNPEAKFMEFGTRRRFSQEWQEYVVSRLREAVPGNMVGTSNVDLARRLGITPMGTSAHEMDMVMSGVYHDSDETIRSSHNRFLQEWFDEYGAGLSIALTDTYGSEFFFKDMTDEQAREWNGLRQDSGDPRKFAARQLGFYESKGINPRTKRFVPSDGLDVEKVVGLQREFGDKINVVSGWGTNLTNDLGVRPLSLVMKAVEANGHGTVKLSDNFSKATGKKEDIERFKRIFSYDDSKYGAEVCTY